MGGYGSGRWRSHNRREVVESCLYVSADDLPLINFPDEDHHFVVRRHGGQIVGRVSCRSILLPGPKLALRFHLPPEDNLEQIIPISFTPTRGSGGRTCFLCPISSGEDFCGRASRKLFAAPRSDHLGCRFCHQLVYSSSQRRAERLARGNDQADAVERMADELFSRLDRGEDVNFKEQMRVMRALSHAIHDLWESLGHSLSEADMESVG